MATTETEIRTLQRRIVDRIEDGKDTADLEHELARLRAEAAAQVEIEQLQGVAERRTKLRETAAAVRQKVRRQGEAIDAFLGARDELLAALQPHIEPMRRLVEAGSPPWEGSGECYLYSNATQFGAAVSSIPKELLGADFACPTLVMAAPGEHSLGQVTRAAMHLQACVGILANFRKGSMSAYTHPGDSALLLDGEGEAETPAEAPEVRCPVCLHERVAEIDKGLQEGRSLRDLEAEYNVSRSTLSRHRNKCGGRHR